MMSCVYEGKVLDWHFKKRPSDTLFYIGDIFVGQLFKIGKTWSGLPAHPRDNDRSLVDGFRSRVDACQYLLQYEGYDTSREYSWNPDILTEQQLREKHPSLKEAWERYQVMRNLYTEHEING